MANTEKINIQADGSDGVKIAKATEVALGNYLHIKEDGTLTQVTNSVERYLFDQVESAYQWTKYDDSEIAKLEPTFPIYTGNTLTVGSGGTYSTLTAAYAAASNGDIIEVLSDMDTALEASGYWLINSVKNVKIKGTTQATKIFSTAGGTGFVIRIRTAGVLLFENITLESNHTTIIYSDASSNVANAELFFKNVIANNDHATGIPYNIFGTTNIVKSYFDNCEFNQANEGWCFNITSLIENIYYFNECTFSNTTTAVQENLQIGVNSKSLNYIYNCKFYNYGSDKIIYIGTDTTAPTYTDMHADIRGCYIAFMATGVSHAVLLGRGTNDITFINNEIYIPPVNDAIAIGLAIKTIATGDAAKIYGNKITAPRPFYIKGGSNIDSQYNYIVQNYALEYAIYINNKHENVDLNCDNLTFKNNYGLGIDNCIGLASDTAQTIANTIATWDFDNNVYYSSTHKYIINGATVYLWDERTSFWTYDENSEFKKFLIIE